MVWPKQSDKLDIPSYQPLIHIGYHKTATTWLQERLFIDPLGYVPVMSHAEVSQHIVSPNGLKFDKGSAPALIAQRVADISEGRIPIISSEILCGNPFYGGRESDVFANRLKMSFPNAKIFISIREQHRMLVSLYMQYLSRGGTLTCERFFLCAPEIGYYRFSPQHLEFHRLIEYYIQLFGKQNVCVLTQEQLAGDMQSYVEALASFSGNTCFAKTSGPKKEHVGVGHPEGVAGLLRLSNFLLSGPVRNDGVVIKRKIGNLAYRSVGRLSRVPVLLSLAKKHRKVSEFVAENFTGAFSESNAILRTHIPENEAWLSTYE